MTIIAVITLGIIGLAYNAINEERFLNTDKTSNSPVFTAIEIAEITDAHIKKLISQDNFSVTVDIP